MVGAGTQRASSMGYRRNRGKRWRCDYYYTLTSDRAGTTFERELVYTPPNAVFALLDWLILRRRMKTDSAEALRRLKWLLEFGGEIN